MYTNDFSTCSRGVLIYVHNSLIAKQLDYEQPPQEIVTVEIKGHNDTLTISSIYRSPNSSEDNDKCIYNFIENLVAKTSGKIMLIGDFNFSDIDWETGTAKSTNSNSFIEILRENFLIQNVVMLRGQGERMNLIC